MLRPTPELSRNSLPPQIFGDQFPVEASVLNENLIRSLARHNDSRQIDPGTLLSSVAGSHTGQRSFASSSFTPSRSMKSKSG